MLDWVESVEEHRETLEKLAETETPLAEDARELLRRVDER